MSKRKLHETTVTIKLYSVAPFAPESFDDVTEAIEAGTVKAGWEVTKTVEVEVNKAVKTLKTLGEDVTDFNIVTDNRGKVVGYINEDGDIVNDNGEVLTPVSHDELEQRRIHAIRSGFFAGQEEGLMAEQFIKKNEVYAPDLEFRMVGGGTQDT